MDQELITYLDRRFGEVETQNRETQIMIEGLRSSQETLAESIVDMNARHDQTREENERGRQKDLAFCTSLFSDLKGRVDDQEGRLGDCEARVGRLESAGG